jgi:hypothetical protein
MGPDIGAGQDDEAESGGERPADLGEAVVADSAVETERVPGLITADEPVLAPMEEGDPELAEGLSDEVVERIAQRVVELMGSDIVREIAWDVVPDLAEVVVKERLRELEAEVD